MPETRSQPDTEVFCLMRAVHDGSPRRARPWVDVNRAALPGHLIESELFGYDKGAFSGAGTSKPGPFELADSGSLFLDERGELEPRAQVKLLRILDGAPYYRLGGTHKVSVDTRVIGFAAICTIVSVSCRLQYLRCGKDETKSSRWHVSFWRGRARSESLSPSAAALLRDHDWPGNLRELRNCMIRAAAMADEGVIEVRHLGPAVTQSADRLWTDRQRAAELPGSSRRTLYRKLRAYEQETVGRS